MFDYDLDKIKSPADPNTLYNHFFYPPSYNEDHRKNFFNSQDKEYFYRIEKFENTPYDYEITYRINKNFFRSQNFKPLSSENINILYSGCSWTYGSGLPEDLTWTNTLSDLIQKNNIKNVESFNVSVQGGSIFLSIKNAMSFIRIYGKPTYIFMNFPSISRDLKFNKKDKNFYPVLFGPGYFEKDGYPKIFIEYMKNFVIEDNIMKNIEQIKMFEDFCNASGIKLLWTYWDKEDFVIYNSFDFNNKIDPDLNFKDCASIYAKDRTYYENKTNALFWEVAQDGVHPGTCWSQKIANTFLKEMSDRKI